MNERIKELAEQCKEYVNESSFITYGPIWWEFYNEKFAELIVRECADVCDLYAMPDGTSETAIMLSAAIKRKFGVE
jgi:hypothetical protein